MKLQSKTGFTLLEIIIVIIIVGVLASLALPRFFSTVEFSRSTEALSSLSAIRQSMERCFLANSGTYSGCTIGSLDLMDPGTSPGAHFSYAVSGATGTGYTLTARRNGTDGGNSTSTITITQSSAGVARSGTVDFAGIK